MLGLIVLDCLLSVKKTNIFLIVDACQKLMSSPLCRVDPGSQDRVGEPDPPAGKEAQPGWGVHTGVSAPVAGRSPERCGAAHGADAWHGNTAAILRGENHEASDTDSLGRRCSPGGDIDRCRPADTAARGTARQLYRSRQRPVHAHYRHLGH